MAVFNFNRYKGQYKCLSIVSTTLMILLKAPIFMKQIVNNSFDFEEQQGTRYVTYYSSNIAKAIIPPKNFQIHNFSNELL